MFLNNCETILQLNHKPTNLRKKFIAISLIPIIILVFVISGVFLFPLLLTPNENLDTDASILKSGSLVMIDMAHWGEGEVQLVEKPDGSYAIYFIDIEIATGPDLYVYLSKKSNFNGLFDSIGENYNLGKLVAFQGTFEVNVPNSLEIGSYNSVLIYCLAFTVIFTYASLT